MSDILKVFDHCKFKEKISLSTEHCLNYVRKDCVAGNQIRFTVNIPNEHLRSWYDLREESSLLSQFSYVEILNASIADHSVKIKDDCTRIEGLIQRSCSNVKSKCRKLQGRARVEYLSGLRKIAIHQDDLIKVGVLEEEIKRMRENAKGVIKENELLQKRCEELYTELQKALQAKMQLENKLDNLENYYEEILQKNNELKEYIDRMETSDDLQNVGKVVSEVGERHQRRKLRELKTHVERALWFAETYGLTLDVASFTDQKGVSHTLSFPNNHDKNNYQDLPEEEKDKIKQILFIMDKFSIGEAAYHELTMTAVGEELPRSYLIRQCKEPLNEISRIERTPGKEEGAQFKFCDELCNTIRNHVSITILCWDKINKTKI